MDLQAYMNRRGLTTAGFADIIGCSRQAVEHWLLGDRYPRPEMLRRIGEKTDGKVTAIDLLSPQHQRRKQ